MTVYELLAETDVDPGTVDPGTGHGPEWGKAAPVALVIILLMGIALFLLIKSMNRQLRKVPASFSPPDDQATVPDGPDPAGKVATPADDNAPPAKPDR